MKILAMDRCQFIRTETRKPHINLIINNHILRFYIAMLKNKILKSIYHNDINENIQKIAYYW